MTPDSRAAAPSASEPAGDAKPLRMFPIIGGPAIPWAAIAPFEAQARENHGGQSLDRLAERGGLGVREAIHVLERVYWHSTRSQEINALSPRDAVLRLQELATLPGVERLRAAAPSASEPAHNIREFGYLLNAMEGAGQQAHPAAHGYALKREAVFAYVQLIIAALRAARGAARAGESQAERHTPDEIRAINQAAAHLDGVLYLSSEDRYRIALALFAIAGNPKPAASSPGTSASEGTP